MPGNKTLIPMKVASGGTVPTLIHLPDASTVSPDATGLFQIPAEFTTAMLNAGLQLVVTGGANHVP